MIKIQIKQKQVNLKNKADYTACPYKQFKLQPVFSCRLNCNRFAGVENGFVLCGKVGANKPFHATMERAQPSLYEVFGDDERDGIIRSYGIPKG